MGRICPLGALCGLYASYALEHADRIVVLHRGEVREEGTHAALLARGGIYARLYRMQYGGQAATPVRAASQP